MAQLPVGKFNSPLHLLRDGSPLLLFKIILALILVGLNTLFFLIDAFLSFLDCLFWHLVIQHIDLCAGVIGLLVQEGVHASHDGAAQRQGVATCPRGKRNSAIGTGFDSALNLVMLMITRTTVVEFRNYFSLTHKPRGLLDRHAVLWMAKSILTLITNSFIQMAEGINDVRFLPCQ